MSLLERGEVDCVIHAEQLHATRATPPYFRASVSRSLVEVDQKRSSFYSPIEFSGVLREVLNDVSVESCCVVAVPCVVTAVALLRKIDAVAASKIKYLFSLVCSHNVNGQFAAGLVCELGSPENKSMVTFRDKVGISDKLNYNICVQTEGQTILRKSRFSTSFTENWRSYAHALESCMYCPDLFGVHASASFKDAWGLSPRYKTVGETVVIANDDHIVSLLTEITAEGRLALTELNHAKLFDSQYETLQFKNLLAPIRIKHKLPGVPIKAKIPVVIRVAHFAESILKRYILRRSKTHFQKQRRFLGSFLLNPATRAIGFLSRLRVFWAIMSRNRDYRSTHFEVLYTAGFGFGNLGDEAQLHANLKNWERLRPDCKVTILSPNPDYTRECHGFYEVIHAARRTLWSGFNIDYFGFGKSKIFMPLFFGKFVWVVCNAVLYKYTRLVFMSPNSAYLLFKLRTADVLHIGGGGFLTGKTASRLYDYMALIWLARLFGTEVILTGQTIGVWRNALQKIFAKQLRKASFIGLRDGVDSVKALQEIGVYDEDKVKVLFDDALFCPPANKDALTSVFKDLGVPNDGYIALHVHYWRVDKSIVNSALDCLAETLDKIYTLHGLAYVLVPMEANDLEAMVYLKQKMSSPIYLFDKFNDFRLSVAAIASAKACITMKHHPIIFAMGSAVPTLSLYFEDYYQHKNIGAMSLFGQQGYVFSHELVNDGQVFSAIDEMLKDRDVISCNIRSSLSEYEKLSGEIIRLFLAYKCN
jgi:polysaccharide pyruvyl transferase WcaK-like protein/coenzyme F420-reducing hydrogenase beta subunit